MAEITNYEIDETTWMRHAEAARREMQRIREECPKLTPQQLSMVFVIDYQSGTGGRIMLLEYKGMTNPPSASPIAEYRLDGGA
jgi:hypothetical protein